VTWFRVDDTFPHHAKVMAAGNAAVGLWVRAGAWSMQQLTDGFIPTHVARSLGSAAEARRLVDAGLWLLVEGGYSFHQWGERQPLRSQVEADREAAKERMRVAREARRKTTVRGNSSQPTDERSPDVRANTERTSDGVRVTPTRPDPTRTSSGSTPPGDAAKPPPARRRRLPDDFLPTAEHIELAEQLGVNLRAEWAKFVDHWRSTGEAKADWPATLRNWIRRAAERSGGQVVPLHAANGQPIVGLAPDDRR
jgi:hypothetical protein